MRRLLTAGIVLAMIGLGCGGGDGGTDPNPPAVTVTVTPARDTLTVGTSTTFTAAVANSGNTGVSWAVIGGAANGSVSPAGVFTAGATPGNVSVVATSDAAPTAKDTAVVQVVAAPNATISSSDSVPEAQTGLSATVPAQAGATYAWTVTGGTITAGQGSASLTYSSAGPGTATVGVTVSNLADSAVTGSRNVTVVAAPVITGFTASRDTVTNGEGTSLTAVFSGGTGSVNQGVGAVTSGVAAPTAPLGTPYVPVTYTLTVTGPLNVTRTAQVSAVAVNPPVLNIFDALTSKAPVGGSGWLEAGWNTDPGVQASISQGIGLIQTTPVQTPTFTTAGPVTFTLTVRSPADSILTDTATIVVVAPAAGSFTTTGSMVKARLGAGVAELQDGRVLLVGGNDFVAGSLVNAELYDPTTGQFAPTGPLNLGRSGPVAVTLDDGRVLVAGFDELLQPTTEFYDPATGQFSMGPNTKASGVASLVKLADGRVIAFTGGTAGLTAEVFDPAADSFAVIAPAGVHRVNPGVVPLLDGRILVAGGATPGVGTVATAELFDPATGTFTATGSYGTPRSSPTFTRLQDGKVLVVGGLDLLANDYVAAAEVFDPATGVWTPAGRLSLPRHGHSAALLSDGRVLVAGGINSWGQVTSFAETFDPATGEFTPLLGTLSGERTLPMTLRLSDGRVLLAGGSAPVILVTAAAELFQ